MTGVSPVASIMAVVFHVPMRISRRLCAGFELDPDADGLQTNPQRVGARDRVIQIVEEAFASWSAEPLLARLAEIGVPAGKVRSLDEVYAWEQTRSQGLLIDVEHASLGPLTLPGPGLRFFTADGTETTPSDHQAPPLLDGQGDAVRQWLREDR